MKNKKLSKKFKLLIDKHIKELENNSKEIEDILYSLVKLDKKTLNSKYKSDLLFIQNTLNEIDDSIDRY